MKIKSTFIRKRWNCFNIIIEYINKNDDVKHKSISKYYNKNTSFKEPKTQESIRTISAPPELMSKLKKTKSKA